ncbi:hypothetical protein EV361DRAFT_865730 [Lentinula raphanica]|nr:hypothetical protein EV361DRAFT_865730 [Lentinula raphanica]
MLSCSNLERIHKVVHGRLYTSTCQRSSSSTILSKTSIARGLQSSGVRRSIIVSFAALTFLSTEGTRVQYLGSLKEMEIEDGRNLRMIHEEAEKVVMGVIDQEVLEVVHRMEKEVEAKELELKRVSGLRAPPTPLNRPSLIAFRPSYVYESSVTTCSRDYRTIAPVRLPVSLPSSLLTYSGTSFLSFDSTEGDPQEASRRG